LFFSLLGGGEANPPGVVFLDYNGPDAAGRAGLS
jgi:hypothetical protein